MKKEEAVAAYQRIVAFNDGYVRMVEAHHEDRAFDLQQEQLGLARASVKVQTDLDRVGLGGYTLIDAPALGGARTPVQITGLMLNMKLSADYNINANDLILQLHKALGVYEPYAKGEEKDPVFDPVGSLLWPIGLAGATMRFLGDLNPAIQSLLGLLAIGGAVIGILKWVA